MDRPDDGRRALQIFLVVYHQNQFSSAARRLHRTPPAISRRIALLEDELGVLLSSAAVMTDVGQALLPHAENAPSRTKLRSPGWVRLPVQSSGVLSHRSCAPKKVAMRPSTARIPGERDEGFHRVFVGASTRPRTNVEMGWPSPAFRPERAFCAVTPATGSVSVLARSGWAMTSAQHPL
jgi:hypothetical protein